MHQLVPVGHEAQSSVEQSALLDAPGLDWSGALFLCAFDASCFLIPEAVGGLDAFGRRLVAPTAISNYPSTTASVHEDMKLRNHEGNAKYLKHFDNTDVNMPNY
jgi:hypothetical protein